METLPTRSEVKSCQFSAWYPAFCELPPNNHTLNRSNVTIKSKTISLPPSFREYLLSDGLTLPKGARTSGLLDINRQDSDSDSWSNSDGSLEKAGESESVPDFTPLCEEIQAAITELGGEIMPKLNWSAPKDAVWVNGSTLKCRTPGDIFILLKSSDFCSFDVQHALGEVSDPDPTEAVELKLVLRKWANLHRSQEFRCFVRDRMLVAICQRNSSEYFEHLTGEKQAIQSLLAEFFDEIVKHNFTDLENYVFDAYIDKKSRIWLIDFNVWGKRTDSLLYSWDELATIGADDAEIRVVETDKELRADPLSSYRAPIDTLYMASVTGGDSKKFEEFMGLCEKPTAGENELADRQRQHNETIGGQG